MARSETYDNDLNLEATELRLGLPGRNIGAEKQSISKDGAKNNKRTSPEMAEDSGSSTNNSTVCEDCPPPSKTQIVGWPPVRSYMKNNLQQKKKDQKTDVSGSGIYVKVSMDGAPYLRKIDLKVYQSYAELLRALENMFKVRIGSYSERDGYNGSDYVPTYEDKDGDWMLVGDVPWDMFISSCKRLRIMKSSEAKGLGCL